MKKVALLTMAVIFAALLAGCAGGGEGDENRPVISGISVSSMTETSAIITWTTNEPATSQVEYGPTTSYGLTTNLDGNLVTSHSVSLSGLTAGTTYHYRVKSEDAAENEKTSGDYTFTTASAGDTTAPVVSGVSASDVTTSTATISWSTDEPATSQVEYGPTTSYGSITPLDSTLVTTHSVSLSGLAPGTTYHYGVKSVDESDNEAVSGDSTFTAAAPPNETPNQPSNVSPADGTSDVSLTPTLISSNFSDPDAGDTHAASQWQVTTTSGDYSSPIFDSGTDATNLANISVPSGTLSSATTYYWKVRHEDNHGAWSAWSEETSFITTEVVTFPDPNLEAAIRETIDKPEGDIKQGDLEGLTELDADDRDISNLSGLEHCTNLTTLTLWGNQLSDITSLSSLTNLSVLYLGNNQISDISPLSSLTNLTSLGLGWSQVNDITPLEDLTSLIYLYLQNSQISDITPLSNLTNLGGEMLGVDLDLSSNQVSDIEPLVNNPGLSEGDTIDLTDNPLSPDSIDIYIPQLEARGVEVLYDEPQGVAFPDPNLEAAIREAIGKPEGPISISDLEGLTTLDASSRDITNIVGLEYCTGLSRLTLRSNQIGDVSPLSNLGNLTSLALSYNQISDIAPFANLTGLQSLELHNNQISNITALAAHTSLSYLTLSENEIGDVSSLSNLVSLRYLSIGYNQISDIAPLSTLTGLPFLSLSGNQIADISPLSNLVGLTSLFLNDTGTSDISPLSGLISLEQLLLNDNQISDISPLENLTNLEGLVLDHNLVNDVTPLQNITGLTNLYLDSNDIIDITPLSNLSSLTQLRLHNNQISDVSPLSGLTSLTSLFLWGNQINDITAFTNLGSLTILHLNGNQISDISPITNLTSLATLELYGNQISDITALANLTSLTKLELGANQISDVSPLQNLTSLTELNLSGNQIVDISPLVDNVGLAEGDAINLQGNPLSAESINALIPQLEARGVTVQHDAP